MPDGEIGWLQEVLGACPDKPPITYLGRPSTGGLELLLPLGPPPAAGASLRRGHDGRRPAERLSGLAAQAAARAGLLRFAPGQAIVLPPFELVEQLARGLGEPELVAAVTLGRRRRNRKPVLQLIRPDGRTVGFAKVGWSPLSAELVANEVAILRHVEGRLPPAVTAPAVILHQPWRDGEVTVTTPVRTPLLGLRRPAPAAAETIRLIAGTGTGTRTGTGAPCPVPELNVLDEWRSTGLAAAIDLEEVIDRHAAVRLDVGLWHGDLTPWNTCTTTETTAVWDWEFAGLGRPIGFDGLHRCFEEHRRSRHGTNDAALAAVAAGADRILEPLGLGLAPAKVAAMVDLYLCELISRELRLSDQRWSAGDLAGLGPVAASRLGRRAVAGHR
jgi:hypothetical protein